MVDKLLIKYAEKFGEAFPLFSAPSDEQEVVKIIKKCLKENKRYKPRYKKDMLYSF